MMDPQLQAMALTQHTQVGSSAPRTFRDHAELRGYVEQMERHVAAALRETPYEITTQAAARELLTAKQRQAITAAAIERAAFPMIYMTGAGQPEPKLWEIRRDTWRRTVGLLPPKAAG